MGLTISHISKLLALFGFFTLLGFTCFGVWTWRKGFAMNTLQPHIVFILADDMGWNDVGFHGSNQIPTPNIDALAYNGVILNRHYVLPICTPSRSALLTGRYPLREGLQGFPLAAGSKEGLPLQDRMLMPEYFRKLGYNTHLVGKWHVGYYSKKHTPVQRGFDSFFGYYNGYISYFDHGLGQELLTSPGVIYGKDFHYDTAKNLKIVNKSGYFTELITNEAVNIIQRIDCNNNKPLFLEIAHLAVHSGDSQNPLEVPNLAVNDETFSYIKNEQRRKYAGMIKSLDESVGKVIAALAGKKILENSIVVFVSDNGAPTIYLYANTGSNYPLRGMKDTLYEGGIRGVACVFSPLISSRSRVSEQMMHITDWLPTLYYAAGGDLAEFPREIDGLNQWPNIVDNKMRSPRVSILINIDEQRNFSGAILGKYKLLKGALSLCEECYGENGDDPSYPAYQTEKVLSSAVGTAISQLFDNYLTETQIKQLREKSTLRCKPSTTPGTNCTDSCLFNIFKDPCENQDVQNDHPKIMEDLQKIIASYQKILKPQDRKLFDPSSDPKNFNGYWMPWVTEKYSSDSETQLLNDFSVK